MSKLPATPTQTTADASKPLVVVAIKTKIQKNLSRRVVVVEDEDSLVQMANALDSSVYPFVGTGAAASAFWQVKRLAETGRHCCIWGEPGTGRSHLARCYHHLTRRPKVTEFDCADGLPSEFVGTTVLLNAGALTAEDWRKLPLDHDFQLVAISHEPCPMPDWVESVRLPPLRDRLADIPALTMAILQRKLRRKQPPVLSDSTLALFYHHNWPGNLTELEGVLERATKVIQGRRGNKKSILPDDLPARLRQDLSAGIPGKRELTQGFLFNAFRRVMIGFKWDRPTASEQLGLSHETLQAVLQDLGLDRWKDEGLSDGEGRLLNPSDGQRTAWKRVFQD